MQRPHATKVPPGPGHNQTVNRQIVIDRIVQAAPVVHMMLFTT